MLYPIELSAQLKETHSATGSFSVQARCGFRISDFEFRIFRASARLRLRGCAEAPDGRRDACPTKDRHRHSGQSRAAGRRDACPTRDRNPHADKFVADGRRDACPTRHRDPHARRESEGGPRPTLLRTHMLRTHWTSHRSPSGGTRRRWRCPGQIAPAPRKSASAKRADFRGWVGGGRGRDDKARIFTHSKASLPVHHTNVEEPAGAPLAHPVAAGGSDKRLRLEAPPGATEAAVPDRGGGLPTEAWNRLTRLCVVCSDANKEAEWTRFSKSRICANATATTWRSTTSAFRSRAVRSSGCWDPTGPARPRPSA